jgi:hypothetical protein
VKTYLSKDVILCLAASQVDWLRSVVWPPVPIKPKYSFHYRQWQELHMTAALDFIAMLDRAGKRRQQIILLVYSLSENNNM